MADEVLENLKMWTADPLCVAAAKRIEADGAEIERLRAENEKLRSTLEIIAEGATDKLKALQARTVLDNIGPATGEQAARGGQCTSSGDPSRGRLDYLTDE